MKRYWPVLMIAAVALITVGSGMLLYRAKQLPTAAKVSTGSRLADGGAIQIRGSPNAPVTLEEFADFQCHACGVLTGAMDQVRRENEQQVRIIFRHFPLAGHTHAKQAAVAAEAAARQGRFWEMHDLLYREQEAWSRAMDVKGLMESYARTLGLDIEQLKKDMESDEVKSRVTNDQQEGRRLGVTSTPTVFINNRALPARALNAPGLRNAIAAELNVQRAR
jgi:protein-disulfide isomerase